MTSGMMALLLEIHTSLHEIMYILNQGKHSTDERAHFIREALRLANHGSLVATNTLSGIG